jgi:hypothetical protein
MGRVKPRRASKHDRRSAKHVAVTDAAQVAHALRAWAEVIDERGRARRGLDPAEMYVAGVAHFMRRVWEPAPVALRTDPDFAAALIDSNTDTELPDGWLERLKFDSIMCALTAPLSIHDGHNLCHYLGFLATGIHIHRNNGARALGGGPPSSSSNNERVLTSYHPFRGGPDGLNCHGIRLLWFFSIDGQPEIQAQTMTVLLDDLNTGVGRHTTIQHVIEGAESNAADEGRPWGEEFKLLVPFGLQLLLYLAAEEPEDLDWPAPESIARPQQLQQARIGHVGWRVGAAVRKFRDLPPATIRNVRPGSGGWRLPPHIRSAHWRRARIAERNAAGVIVGSVQGEQGTDWHYEARWIPPALVNADDGVPPTVRDVEPEP